MSGFWSFVLPGTVLVVAGLAVRWAARLQFFSHAARDLDHIDIPNEVSEIRINELEILVGDEADFYFKCAWKLTRWERRRAVTSRLRETRKWLHLIISNAALFQEVARFHIRAAASVEADSRAMQNGLPFQVMDRAALVQFMAAVCLAKVMLIELYRLIWPIYVPEMADQFQVRRHDLIAWYKHLAKEMLQLTQRYYDDLTYTRFIFQLTGLFSVEDAPRLNRL